MELHKSKHCLAQLGWPVPGTWYKHADDARTFEVSHNVDDPYRNSHAHPPRYARRGGQGMGWGEGMDIAIGVTNVMTYFECHGIVDMLVTGTWYQTINWCQVGWPFTVAERKNIHAPGNYLVPGWMALHCGRKKKHP